jgi:hypothetical protein
MFAFSWPLTTYPDWQIDPGSYHCSLAVDMFGADANGLGLSRWYNMIQSEQHTYQEEHF